MANELLTPEKAREVVERINRVAPNKTISIPPDYSAINRIPFVSYANFKRDLDLMGDLRREMTQAVLAMEVSAMIGLPPTFGAPRWGGGAVRSLGPAPPPPVAVRIEAPAGEIDPELLAHEALAKKLGITCVAPEIAEYRLRQVLAEEGITCYDRKTVEQYLDTMAERAQAAMRPGEWGRMTWAWFAAREADLLPGAKGDERAEGSVYSEPIPLPVLMTMERIVDRLGDQVRFLVGAITKGDPFLAVVARGSQELFVIERWDEPGFRA